jgi:hypothetical protein
MARGHGDIPAMNEGEARTHDLAGMIAALWPVAPSAQMLDWICDLLDWRGEDIVRLAEAIENADHAVDGLWRKLIRRVDATLGVPTAPVTGYALDLALDQEGARDSALSDMLMAAFAYVVDTRQHKLTRNASKFTPVMDHCWRQVQDPLFFAFRKDSWWKRVRVLLQIYKLVYRILDEAARMGVTSGAAFFAQDLGRRVDELLLLLEGQPEDPDRILFGAERVLLARDRCRYSNAGLAALSGVLPKLADDYVSAINAACRSVPDFSGLRALAAKTKNDLFLGKAVTQSLVADVAEVLLAGSRPSSDLDNWWRTTIAHPDFQTFDFWDNLVTAYARHRSDLTDPRLKPAERDYGLRYGL